MCLVSANVKDENTCQAWTCVTTRPPKVRPHPVKSNDESRTAQEYARGCQEGANVGEGLNLFLTECICRSWASRTLVSMFGTPEREPTGRGKTLC